MTGGAPGSDDPDDLYATEMRRAELSRLNRADLRNGWSAKGLITGSPQSIWKVVRKGGRLADVEVTHHHLRHRKTPVMLNNDRHLSEVQDILGHASPETTKEIYAPCTTQHPRDASDQFSLPAETVARRARVEGLIGMTDVAARMT